MTTVGIEEIRESALPEATLKVVGVGGGGGNAVNRMIDHGLGNVEFMVANTDVQDLKKSKANHKLQLGPKCTRGLGAGAKPDLGREAAMEELEMVREHLAGVDMVFITAGLGGGTGTGASPVIAELAREEGCLTVGIVTKPFKFEGKVRQRNGEEGILQLRKHVDTLIVIPNDNLLMLANKKTSILDAFSMADDVLRVAVTGISTLINKSGLINLDFADVHAVMSNMGQAIMGTGVGTGDNRAVEAAGKAIRSPLLEDCRIDGALGVLIHVAGPPSLTLHEVNEAAELITDHADDDANIIFGASIEEDMENEQIEVTVIATGFGAEPYMKKSNDVAKKHQVPASFSAFAEDEDSAPEFGADIPELAPVEPEEAFRSTFAEHALEVGEEQQEEDEEEVLELEDPIMEPIETAPQIPTSYKPEEKPGGSRNGRLSSDYDVPAFIRRRSKQLAE
ncbi:MAG: cell division protein FtsZ [SAR324 cluster bacterium]|nr:cell division protein FtsZ [SAR324 cluster bacterium]MCZ6558578.1 cell division protein FtsZ [SAR324 cluster bacterium]MCZ6644912.1 cell division protein FtsZ [SAR324 cluster bacterium]